MIQQSKSMSKAELDRFRNYFRDAMKDGSVEWVAISIKFVKGARVAIHSSKAPNRPKGIVS